MHIPLTNWLAKLPLPADDKWTEGVWDIEALRHGSMSLVLFTPKGHDYQSPHEQDELYIVLRGNGIFQLEQSSISFAAGDVLFVPAHAEHRFVEFSEDLITWAVFWGPIGGERNVA